MPFPAGRSIVPRDPFEAGSIDGADWDWGPFARVTGPMLDPATPLFMVLKLLRAVSEFDTAAMPTGGRPVGAMRMIHFILLEIVLR